MASKGGARPGAGRKTKAEILGLAALMDKAGPSETLFHDLYAMASDPKNKNQMEAIKLWLAYKFGTPKQSIAFDGGVEVVITHES